jgi:hypothetical protein
LAAAGGLATSGPHYTYEKGPDGVIYAVGGEVRIDTSPGQTPEETLRRAQTIRAAALAPSDPSAQDRAVAAEAAQMAAQARLELTRERADEAGGELRGSPAASPPSPLGLYFSDMPGGRGGALDVYA